MSLSFRACSSPMICPPNFEEGPQILARFIFFETPFKIFSAASLNVEPCFRIIGSLLACFFGSFV